MKRFYKFRMFLMAVIGIVIIFLTTTCKKDPKDDTTDDGPIPETTKIIDQPTWQDNLISLDSTSYTFTFNNDLIGKVTLKPGDILVSGEGYGYLRKITSIVQEGDNIKVYTSFASLNEAVRNGNFTLQTILSEQKIQKITYYKQGIRIDTSNMKSTEATNIEATIDEYLDENHNVHIAGNFSMLPAIICELEINMFKVVRFNIEYEIEEQINLKSTLELLNLEFSEEVELANITFTPITVFLGPVPVVIVPEIEIIAGAELNVQSKVTTSINQQMSYSIGLLYEKKIWTPYQEVNKSFTIEPPTLSATANAKAYIKPQLNLKFYGAVAPYLYGEAYGSIEADISQNPWWKLYAGANVGAGVEMEIFGKEIFDWPETPFYLFEYETEIANSTNFQFNQAPSIPSEPQPQNNQTNIPTTVDISWQCEDPDGDPLTFDIYFGTTTAPPLVASGISAFTYNPGTLLENETYYWKIIANDDHDHTTPGVIWQFTTVTNVINLPPLSPSNPNPVNGALSVSLPVTLTWNCSDPENDPLLYDVFFGTTIDPPIAQTNQNSTSFQPSGLINETQYYWKILAKDDHGNIMAGNLWSFTTETGGGTSIVTDIDGNVYQTVIIGTQEWMAENLKVTHYSSGDAIPNVTGNSQWNGLTTGAYCWNNNDINWKNAYGALYNWYAAVDSRGLCPVGWHVPTDAEWTILTNYLGGSNVAGGKMKSTRTEPDAHPRWKWPNTGATNESSFSGLPGGFRYANGAFYNHGWTGNFWSSSETSSASAWHRSLGYNDSDVYGGNDYEQLGFSVRCLRD